MGFRNLVPMKLQFFSNGDGGNGDGSQGGAQPNPDSQQTNTPQIDYDRIQNMLNGTLQAKEDTALKAYFKQQGLSQADAEQAMAAFKQQREANTPDTAAIQAQLSQTQTALQQSQINAAAQLEAFSLGIDAKSIPYVLKMADFSEVVGQDGKINQDNLLKALNKVLEDVPALKGSASNSNSGNGNVGGFSFGAPGGAAGSQNAVDDKLDKIFGIKKQ